MSYPHQFSDGRQYHSQLISNYPTPTVLQTAAAIASHNNHYHNHNSARDGVHVVQLPPIRRDQFYHYQSQREAENRCRALLITLSFVVAVVSFVSVFVILFGRRYCPHFQLNSATLVAFDSQITTTNWNITFSVTNPNRGTTISYDVVQAVLFHKGQLLVTQNMSPFSQYPKEQTLVHANLMVSNSIVDGSRRRGLDFDLSLQAMIRFHPGTRSEVKGLVWGNCEHVKIEFSSSNSTSGSRKCYAQFMLTSDLT